MLRPDPRTRILSVGAGATALVAALALAFNPPSDLDPLGSLGTADAAAPAAAPAAPPAASVIEGIDLTALGYTGPDLAATTVEQLSAPMPALPTERAAAVRDRLNAAEPHLRGLHQAKNLLRKAATKQDHHLYAAKVAAAQAEKAKVEAEARLAQALAEATRPVTAPATGVASDDEGPAVEAAALVADRHDAAGSAGSAAKPGKGSAQGDAAAEKGEATAAPSSEGTGSDAPAGKAPKKGGDGSDDAAADPASSGRGGRAGTGASDEDEATAATKRSASVAGAAGAPQLEGRAGLTAEEVLRNGREVERLATELAEARATAARQWAELERRRERRSELLSAAEVAEQETARFDAHIRWLGAVLDKAQRRMLSAGAALVDQGRGAADLPIVEVRGFEVHAAIADSVRQLVDAAAAAGIDLEGRAYRPVSRQIELRRQNCGPTDYDIYEKPSSLCSPPTAKPGRSLHELGLALDLMNGENSITSRRDPAFRWLAANAPAYGLYNLPAEPWHWSVTSQ